MAKMRVHELAKELNIKSQDILDKLKNTKFDGKSASSNMEDEAQALIRGAFAKETKSAADAKKPEAAKTGAGKPADGKERPKKKSSITAVFNAQYSKQSRKPANGNNNNRGNSYVSIYTSGAMIMQMPFNITINWNRNSEVPSQSTTIGANATTK